MNGTTQIECIGQLKMKDVRPMGVLKKKLDTGAIIGRMRDVLRVQTDVELASELGLSANAASNWRQRDRPPLLACVGLCLTHNVSLDWLIFGIDPTHMSGGGVEKASRSVKKVEGLSPQAQRVTQFVRAFDVAKPAEDTIWLEQHLKRTVPEYAQWLIGGSLRDQ